MLQIRESSIRCSSLWRSFSSMDSLNSCVLLTFPLFPFASSRPAAKLMTRNFGSWFAEFELSGLFRLVYFYNYQTKVSSVVVLLQLLFLWVQILSLAPSHLFCSVQVQWLVRCLVVLTLALDMSSSRLASSPSSQLPKPDVRCCLTVSTLLLGSTHSQCCSSNILYNCKIQILTAVALVPFLTSTSSQTCFPSSLQLPCPLVCLCDVLLRVDLANAPPCHLASCWWLTCILALCSFAFSFPVFAYYPSTIASCWFPFVARVGFRDPSVWMLWVFESHSLFWLSWQSLGTLHWPCFIQYLVTSSQYLLSFVCSFFGIVDNNDNDTHSLALLSWNPLSLRPCPPLLTASLVLAVPASACAVPMEIRHKLGMITTSTINDPSISQTHHRLPHCFK